jgi:hypothetical protein
MKKIITYCTAATFALGFYQCNSDETKNDEKAAEEIKPSGLAGDNLDLYAVLELFKDSKSPEAFEKKLNDKSGKVNNLDLNGDSIVDYIRVLDEKKDDAHAIILRVPLNEEESQDVAVIEVSKPADKTANVQIIGDEALYGKDYIVEPKAEDNSAGFVMVTTSGVNVWMWPTVTYIYHPSYVVYESPWYYESYPTWYEPWTPVAYEVYHPVVLRYHAPYYRPDGYRAVHVHEHYAYNVRKSSPNIYHGPRRGVGNDGRQREHSAGIMHGPRGGRVSDGRGKGKIDVRDEKRNNRRNRKEDEATSRRERRNRKDDADASRESRTEKHGGRNKESAAPDQGGRERKTKEERRQQRREHANPQMKEQDNGQSKQKHNTGKGSSQPRKAGFLRSHGGGGREPER